MTTCRRPLLIGRLIPALTALLAEHNAAVREPELRMRLRAVVHAGEVHDDDRGFYGDDIDAAFRLLEAPTVKRALRDAPEAPLVLVVSEEILATDRPSRDTSTTAAHRAARSRSGSGGRRRRGRVHLPVPARPDRPPGPAGPGASCRPALSTAP